MEHHSRPSAMPVPECSPRAAESVNFQSRCPTGNNEFNQTQKREKLEKKSGNLKARFHKLKIGNINVTTARDDHKFSAV